MILFAQFAFLAALAQARPQTNIREALEDVADDLRSVIASKSGAVNFVTDLTMNATLETFGGLDLEDADLELALNNTEEAIKANKIQVIETLFDAKRQVIRALGAIKEEHAGALSEVYNTTLEALQEAADSTAVGLSVSKEFIGEAYAGMTLENANQAVINAQDVANEAVVNVQVAANDALLGAQDLLLDAYNATTSTVQATGEALVYAILSAKENLHELAENFDSQQAIHNGTISVGLAINASLHGAELAASDIGVFEALDQMVQGIAQIPAKINSFLFGGSKIMTNNQERSKRNLESMSTQEFEDFLKQELQVWTNFNRELERQLRMLRD